MKEWVGHARNSLFEIDNNKVPWDFTGVKKNVEGSYGPPSGREAVEMSPFSKYLGAASKS